MQKGSDMGIRHTIIAGYSEKYRKKVIIHGFSRSEDGENKSDAILINYGFVREGRNPDSVKYLQHFEEITGTLSKVNDEFALLYKRLLDRGYEMSVVSQDTVYYDFNDMKARLPVVLFSSIGKNILSTLFPEMAFSSMASVRRSPKGVFGEERQSSSQERYAEFKRQEEEALRAAALESARLAEIEKRKAQAAEKKALESIDIYGAF